MKVVRTENAPAPIGPYSQAIVHAGMLYTAGQIGLDPSGVMPGDVKEQAELVMRNLHAVLDAGGASLSSIVKTTIFLTDLNDFTAVNEVYATFFDEIAPARSTVEVSALPKGAKVEIEAVAALVGA